MMVHMDTLLILRKMEGSCHYTDLLPYLMLFLMGP